MTKHLYSLDCLRGFAAISVCLFHFSSKLDYLPDSDSLKVIFSSGHYGVEIFFIISGLVIPYSMAKGRYTLSKMLIFLKKRIIRIEPPYIACLLLVLTLNYATTLSPVYSGNPFTIDYLQLFYHLGYLNGLMGKDWLNQVFWTLAIEFQYYLLMAFFFPLFSHKNRFVWIFSLLAFNASAPFFDRNFVFNFSIFFSAGILLYRFLVNKLNLVEAAISAAAVLSVLIFNYSYKEVFLTLSTSIVILLPLKPIPIATFFGNISYSLYLLHFPIGLRVINLTQRFSESQFVRELMVFGALLVSVIAAYCYYKLLEKPFRLISQQVRYQSEEKQSTPDAVAQK